MAKDTFVLFKEDADYSTKKNNKMERRLSENWSILTCQCLLSYVRLGNFRVEGEQLVKTELATK